MRDDITVIVLTYNEENNIKSVLNSVAKITKNIFVVDSYSTDKTVAILKELNITYQQHPFENYSIQRNWAQQQNPFATEWVLNLDADEPITQELAEWLLKDFENQKNTADGFMFSRKTIFMGRWIKHGDQYPNYHLRLYKASKGKCEDKAYDQHFVVDGTVKKIPHADIINTVATNIDDFVLAHNRWATKEAYEITTEKSKGNVEPKLYGNPIERKRWLKANVFERAPLFSRSFLYFFYRYFLRWGFLDGKPGLIFFVLQSFWFRFLIDAKVYELTLNKSNEF
ncbi:MAG: glycosyltransferase family 2 protein [Methylovulum miyakonense]|uniref:glycosyltransferase family 2 protein n=1 Tax=Methylovulum miyakonense TaxID=645578 RepID=UPI003BB74825